MDENKVLKITVDRISSKAVEDPLQVGFTFVIDGFVYQVYEVRKRGSRKFVKLLGKAHLK
jgi:hypothetical protein